MHDDHLAAFMFESGYRGVDAGIGHEFPELVAIAVIQRGQPAIAAAYK